MKFSRIPGKRHSLRYVAHVKHLFFFIQGPASPTEPVADAILAERRNASSRNPKWLLLGLTISGLTDALAGFGTDVGHFNEINPVELPETSKWDVLGPLVAFIVPVLALVTIGLFVKYAP